MIHDGMILIAFLLGWTSDLLVWLFGCIHSGSYSDWRFVGFFRPWEAAHYLISIYFLPISDSVGLVNRTLILAVYNFPIIINLFAGGLAAQRFINSGEWRWAYGKLLLSTH